MEIVAIRPVKVEMKTSDGNTLIKRYNVGDHLKEANGKVGNYAISLQELLGCRILQRV